MAEQETLEVRRVRHEIKRRKLRVRDVARLAPHMVRVTLEGEELADFVSASFDDHVKVFFPAPEGAEPAKRDYTPRRFDTARRELAIDFVLHGEGPATEWAAAAKAGDALEVGGPRGSFVIPAGFDTHVLIGDASALPAIARRLEELAGRARVIALVAADPMALPQAEGLDVRWVEGSLLDAVRALPLPEGETYWWAAGESAEMRALHQHLVQERGVDKKRVRASSYWRRGDSAVHETFEE
ncbi:siderophore-interacting protein [Ramlibacter sp. XY19]|uniref:siderophore-interacting protein n=1 Tax=Ramlibacter paludis TaxID=2908000 RepID=UPI0023DBA219|nr:siderophore-interacting protein [Ramlibacter paludis]MCG2595657.1 siderophore-interacting protein [Ramlibacter paludis]